MEKFSSEEKMMVEFLKQIINSYMFTQLGFFFGNLVCFRIMHLTGHPNL